MLCGVRRRQPAEVSGVSDEVGWRIRRHAAVRVLLPGSAPRPAELQIEGVRSKVVPHRLERCEYDAKPSGLQLLGGFYSVQKPIW